MRPLGEVLTLSIQYLKDKKVPRPRLVAESFISHVLGLKRMDLYLHFECPLKEDELLCIRSFLKRAAFFEPPEYIIQEVEFYGLVLPISPDVLIPRQETEILVDKAASFIQKKGSNGKVLFDVCAGSGCIGLSLKNKFPGLSIFLSDLSGPALTVCQKGALKNGVEACFLQGDLLTPFSGKRADYLFCNPPYISNKEYADLEISVREFEPKMALVGGETGLEFYKRLSQDLPGCLNPGANVFLEIGHEQGRAVSEIFSNPCWIRKELVQDWAGKDRFFFLEIE